MSKLLYYQDSHCKGVTPSRRTDNYYESWILKFKEMLAIAKKNKVDYIISGGDDFDTPVISNTIVDDILDLIEEASIPFYLCWGSHNMIGHSRATSNTSSLAHMVRRCKLLREQEIIEDDYSIIKIISHEHGIENQIKENGIVFGDNEKYKICVTHLMLTPTPFRPDVLHVVADDIKTDADLILTAHYHQPWDRVIGMTRFLNIGCFGRTEISESNIHPSVCLLDTKKRSVEVIPLKKANAGSEVFDLEAKAEETETSKDLDTFVSSLKDFKHQDADIRGNIEFIAKEQNIDRKVIGIILNKLTQIEKGE